MALNKYSTLPLVVFLTFVLLFSGWLLALADTTSTLRPTADGNDDSGDWKNAGGASCNTTDCYLEVDESSGGSCTNSDGDASYIEAKPAGASLTFDIDESSVPNNATITAIDITICHKYKKSSASNTFQTRRCIDASCANSNADITAEAGYAETTQSHSGLSITKTDSTDIEIGIVTTGTEIIISQVSAVVTYTASDTTAPAAVSNLAIGTPTTTSLPLTWTAPGDDGSTGTAATYDVHYSTAAINDGNFSSATAAAGEPTPSVAGSSESMTISGLSVNTQYYIALKTDDEVPNTSDLSNILSAYTLANTPVAASFGTVTESSIVTDWVGNDNPSGTQHYAENQTVGTNSGWITDTTWTSSNLDSETSYTFRVKTRNGDKTETAWVNLGNKSTLATDSSDSDDSSSNSDSSANPTITTTTTTTTIPSATGPTVAAPVIAPEADAAEIGAPGTTTSDISAGETTTQVPILPSAGDTTPPTITLTSPPEVIDETKITLAGEATETKDEFSGVIASLAYSFDNGISWHPVSSAEGLGTEEAIFTITTPPLPDGTYDIIVRARDNTDNEGLSETTQATIDLLPVIFGSAVLLQSSGDAFLTANPTTVAGAPLRFIAAFEGGVTEAQANLGEQVVPLKPDNIKRRFSGIITLDQPGSYPFLLKANDGAGNSFEQEIGVVTVVPALQVIDHKTGEPLAGAQVTLEKFDSEAKVWWLDKAPGQENPQAATEEGSVILLADRGTYRLRIKAAGHWHGVTRKLFLSEPSTLTGTVRLPRRQWYKYFIPLRIRPLSLTAENVVTISPPETFGETRTLELTAHDTANIERTLDEFLGHRVLLTTIAAWNRTSHEQLVILQRLQDTLGKDVTIIPWLIQQPGSVLSGILQRGHYNLTGFADSTGQDTETLGRTIFPTHFLLDRQGNLRKTRTGFATTDELIELLRDVQ